MAQVKCHYEVLGVSQDASDDDLKKAYRKLALKLHPVPVCRRIVLNEKQGKGIFQAVFVDKNPERAEECTKLFTAVQIAYDILSDPQERAWYDKHREAIIHGGFGDDFQGTEINIMPYFSSSVFNGYGDDDGGFYAVYSDLFKRLAAEDKKFLDDEDEDGSEDIYPEFGDSQSKYEEVVQRFYSFWQSYNSAKTFVWVEKYDTRDAPNRRVARLMEKDNKKLRDAARKEWNEQIRHLVAFVRKRDRRVQQRKKDMEEKEAERRKQLERRREEERKERAKQFEEYSKQGEKLMAEMEADYLEMERNWASEFGDEPESSSDGGSDSQLDEYDYSELDDLYCVACNKAFKSVKAFTNHEKSKKHKENVERLKEDMLDEERHNGVTNDDEENAGRSEEDDADIADVEESKTKLSKKQKKKRRQQKKMQDSEDIEETMTLNSHIGNPNSDSRIPTNENVDLHLASDLSSNLILNENETANGVGKSSADGQIDGVCQEAEDPMLDGAEEETDSIRPFRNQSKPKKKKKAKGSQVNSTNSSQTFIRTNVLACNVCQKEFNSRNKLFDHIKDTGHALRIPNGQDAHDGDAEVSKKGKKKGRRK